MQRPTRRVVAPPDARALANTRLFRARSAVLPPQFRSGSTKQRVSQKRIARNRQSSAIQLISRENSHAKVHTSHFVAHVARRRHSRGLFVRANKIPGSF